MTDTVSPEKRSSMMSAVHGKDTLPELRVRKALHAGGFRFRLYRKDLPGRPDIVLPKHKLAVFVHGCFWHGHAGCKRAKLPSTRIEYWAAKIARNTERDGRAVEELQKRGWRVAIVWGCYLREATDADALTEALRDVVESQASLIELRSKEFAPPMLVT
jgi:DNA mismatch endonuclease (patch repair protein)